jgi:hypothetical protein
VPAIIGASATPQLMRTTHPIHLVIVMVVPSPIADEISN